MGTFNTSHLSNSWVSERLEVMHHPPVLLLVNPWNISSCRPLRLQDNEWACTSLFCTAYFFCSVAHQYWHRSYAMFLTPHREARTDSFSSISKRPTGSESPNFYLDQESRRLCTIGDYDKLSVPIEAKVVQPRRREHKPSRGQFLLKRNQPWAHSVLKINIHLNFFVFRKAQASFHASRHMCWLVWSLC